MKRMPAFLLIARALASEPVHVELAGADTTSALLFLATVGDINFIAGAPLSPRPVSGVFTTPTVRELFDRLSEAQGYRSVVSAGVVVLSVEPLGQLPPAEPRHGAPVDADVEGAPFAGVLRFIGSNLDCAPLVAWNDVHDAITMRLKRVPADMALHALLAIEGQSGACKPGGFLYRTGTGADHRLVTVPAGADQPEPQQLPPGVTVRRRGRTWLVDAPASEVAATRLLLRNGRDDPWPSMETDGPGWLQGYPVERLRLVGTGTGIAQPAALVVDPSGTAHSIRLGTYVGRNWGRVTAISAESVTVSEEYQTLEGELVTNTIVMQLGQPASPSAGG